MLGQAQWLVAQINANTKINMKTDWKVKNPPFFICCVLF
jgi:hypothetical protein